MGLAIQVGLLAAFIVVFLPLGMAGLHLTRNKLLFFSVALFITLAVSVHVAPYFPSASSLFSQLKPQWKIVPDRIEMDVAGHSLCISLLHDMTWESESSNVDDEDYDRNLSDPCMLKRIWSWDKNVSNICNFQKVNRSDARQFLKGSWIMVAGDSQARFFLLALLDQLFSSTEFLREDLFKRHSNYSLHKHQTRLDFVWAPYIDNLTNLVLNLRRDRNYPDVLIMGDGLWHMLHVTNASEYFQTLAHLHNAIYSLLPASSYFSFFPSTTFPQRSTRTSRLPQMFWINVPMLVNPMLNTEEKRQKLTKELSLAYENQLTISKVLQPQGPFTLLDLGRLSQGCGVQCTLDGMHYCNLVYEAAVQVMLNSLLIATQQAPSK